MGLQGANELITKPGTLSPSNKKVSFGEMVTTYGGRLSAPFSDFLPPTSALAKKKSGSAWWPYGGRLSDPFSVFLPPTSALAKKKSVTPRWVIGSLIGRGSSQVARAPKLVSDYFLLH